MPVAFKLNLQGDDQLQQGYNAIMRSCRAYQADADIAGVLVTPMAAKGVEVIIGVSRDPIFGPVLMFGLGGIFVEILKDVAFRSIPVSRQDAWDMINQIQAKQILEGARGEKAIDKESLVELLLTISRIIEAHPEIGELDLNPVIAYPEGYAVVDARIIVEQKSNCRTGEDRMSRATVMDANVKDAILTLDQGVALLTLNRDDVRNALTGTETDRRYR